MQLQLKSRLVTICLIKSCNYELQSLHSNRGHPDNENQSDGRNKTINIFRSSKSNVQYKSMKFQLVRCDEDMTTVSVNELSSTNG